MLLYIAVIIAVICSVVGDFLVKEASAKINPPSIEKIGGLSGIFNPKKLFRYMREAGVFYWKLWVGISFHACFFVGYLLAIKMAPVTIVVPFMSSVYIIDTFLGKYVLHEQVNKLRWLGVIIIVCGIVLLFLFRE